MKRERVLQVLEERRLVPVVRAPSAELALAAANALVAGGVRVLEITMTVPDAVSAIRTLREEAMRFPEAARPVIGAGTVLTSGDADACIDAGAQFVVTPGLSLPLVEHIREREIAVMPGALTPTEVIAAWQAGADMVKIFPCSAMGGARYLKSLRAPLPTVKLFPTGGVKLENVDEYLAAGASAVGVGGELVDMKLLSEGQHERLTSRARAFVDAIARC
ncbi:MAG: bifunctional 4-hydroxy-2-oxoglutarate aldolase/2-dehydro-3-deoxy-phosphogluconate aldolase [Myxococcota bacterium]